MLVPLHLVFQTVLFTFSKTALLIVVLIDNIL